MSLGTIDRLIVASEKLIAQGGTSGLRLKAVVEEANVGNAAAVNYHFRNKAGLIQATIEYRIPDILHHRRGIDAILSQHPDGNSFHFQILLILFPIFEIISRLLPNSFYGRMLLNLDITNPDMVKSLTERTRDLNLGFRAVFEEARQTLENLVGPSRCAELSTFLIGAAAQAIGEIERELCSKLKAGDLQDDQIHAIMDYGLYQLLLFLVNGALQNSFKFPEQEFYQIIDESRRINAETPA